MMQSETENGTVLRCCWAATSLFGVSSFKMANRHNISSFSSRTVFELNKWNLDWKVQKPEWQSYFTERYK